jgi:hypothetical protein
MLTRRGGIISLYMRKFNGTIFTKHRAKDQPFNTLFGFKKS